MQTGWISMMLVLLCISCSTVKEKLVSTNNRSIAVADVLHVEQSGRHTYRDSLGTYWFFSTDSSFYFHPDSGLLGAGGMLYYQSRRLQEGASQQSERHWDSIGGTMYSTSEDIQSRVRSMPKVIWYLSILVALAILLWMLLRVIR